MKYKIHEKYESDLFWTAAKLPDGFEKARNCGNCAKSAIMAIDSCGKRMVCNEVTEYTGLWETGVPRGYSRQPSYVYDDTVCPKHKFEHEMVVEEAQRCYRGLRIIVPEYCAKCKKTNVFYRHCKKINDGLVKKLIKND